MQQPVGGIPIGCSAWLILLKCVGRDYSVRGCERVYVYANLSEGSRRSQLHSYVAYQGAPSPVCCAPPQVSTRRVVVEEQIREPCYQRLNRLRKKSEATEAPNDLLKPQL